jgi:hypothetical protein
MTPKRITRLAFMAGPFASLAARTTSLLVTVPKSSGPPQRVMAMIVPPRAFRSTSAVAGKNAGNRIRMGVRGARGRTFDALASRSAAMGGTALAVRDCSLIVGTLKQRTDAPVAGAVPWLLLATKSNGPEGRFSKVTSIQRVNTVGGVAPAADCSRESAGTTARVQYTADYYFFTDR